MSAAKVRGVLRGAVVLLPLAACFPKTTGVAPCNDDSNCPTGQVCTVNKVCDVKGAPGCFDAGVAVNLRADPFNCGACKNACPVPVNAPAVCVDAGCGRGSCNAGFFDMDGAKTFGCESTCVGNVCTDAAGNKVTLTVPPLPERGAVAQALSSGAAFGTPQTNAKFTNFAVLGESTPVAIDGGVRSVSATYQHVGGFMGAVHP